MRNCWTNTGQARPRTRRHGGRTPWTRSGGVLLDPSDDMWARSVLGLRLSRDYTSPTEYARMRTALVALSIGLVASLLPGPQVACQDHASIDLFGRNMKDWSRLGTGKTPWRLTGSNTLYCDRANDLYVAETELGDGTLTFEYRLPDRRADRLHRRGVGPAHGRQCRVQGRPGRRLRRSVRLVRRQQRPGEDGLDCPVRQVRPPGRRLEHRRDQDDRPDSRGVRQRPRGRVVRQRERAGPGRAARRRIGDGVPVDGMERGEVTSLASGAA